MTEGVRLRLRRREVDGDIDNFHNTGRRRGPKAGERLPPPSRELVEGEDRWRFVLKK